jgi:outer membrane protein assembly factor BamB
MGPRRYTLYEVESRRNKDHRRLVFWLLIVSAVVIAGLVALLALRGCGSDVDGTGDGSTTTVETIATVDGDTTTTEETESTTTTIPTSPNTTIADYDPSEPGDVRIPGSFYGPINTTFEGLTTFRGNASRTYYGEGPVPSNPRILWKFGPMSGTSTNLGKTTTWTGTGWTGQPCIFERDGTTWVVFGAYDYKIHFLDAATGERLLPDFKGGDLFKGSAVVDPDGYPLVYMGCRDNKWRIIAIDREEPTELFNLDADALPNGIWNDDWDASVLIRNDYAFEPCENGHFYILKLNRSYDAEGRVTVDPKIVLDFVGWTQTLLANIGSKDVGIENSPCLVGERLYFSNSGGLVTCLDVGATLEELAEGEAPAEGPEAYPVLFQYWTGEDTDATIVADEQGYIYVCQHSDNARQSSIATQRAGAVGQIFKMDPRKAETGEDPIVWSQPVTILRSGEAGVWATPTLYKDMLYVSTHNGAILGFDRQTGEKIWRKDLSYHDWASASVVDQTLVVGDTNGILHAWDVTNTRVDPPAVWSFQMPTQHALESSPGVWKGRIYIGSRDGYFYCLGD